MRRSFLWMLVTLVVTLAGSASAQVVYTYVGPDFDTVLPPYTTDMRITGSFELTEGLSASTTVNLRDSPSLVAFSFFDGVETRDNTNTEICEFWITTDGGGRIVEWWLALFENGGADPQHAIDMSLGNNRGSFSTPYGTCVEAHQPPFTYGLNLAGVNGVWGGGPLVVDVPTASDLGLAALGLALISAALLRLRAAG